MRDYLDFPVRRAVVSFSVVSCSIQYNFCGRPSRVLGNQSECAGAVVYIGLYM